MLVSRFFVLCNKLMVLECQEDVFWGILISGNSKDVIYVAIAAKARKMKVVALTGSRDSKLSEIADITIRSSEIRTYMIQE